MKIVIDWYGLKTKIVGMSVQSSPISLFGKRIMKKVLVVGCLCYGGKFFL